MEAKRCLHQPSPGQPPTPHHKYSLLGAAEILPNFSEENLYLLYLHHTHSWMERNECLDKWRNKKTPTNTLKLKNKCMRHQLLCLSVTHKALVKSKRLFPPVSRCKGTKLINFLVITAQHWRGREAVRQMPLGATLTFNCKPREESQCPRSLGLETGSV